MSLFPVKRNACIAISAVAIVLIVLAFGLGYYVGWVTTFTEPELHGAVASIAPECAKIGSDILKRMGSAADAAIATLFCEGVTTMQSMGLGGGFVLTIYTKSNGLAETLTARETAPVAAHRDMFVNVSNVGGPLSIAVPGELKGYSELYKRYGHLPWRELIQPSIDLCRNGYAITSFLAGVLRIYENHVKTTPEFSSIFVNPNTGELYGTGDIVRREKLAETLELIAEEGADSLYTRTGTMANLIVNEMRAINGIIAIEDFVNYQAQWGPAQRATVFNDKTMYTVPLPASGNVLIFIMNFLNNFLPAERTVTFYHRLVESFKYAYGIRTRLGDQNFVPEVAEIARNLTDPAYAAEIRKQHSDDSTSQDFGFYGANFSSSEDHGTAHISVLAPNGDAVSVTSTINTFLGSKIISSTTGIVFNDEMDDFSTPGVTNAYGLEASPANYIEPGKRPLSSMCPTIVVDGNGDVRLIIGAAGGARITTAVASIITRHFVLNEPVAVAVGAVRVHHQLAPMRIDFEQGLETEIQNGLISIGHVIRENPSADGFAAVSAVSNNPMLQNGIEAVSDARRNGSVSIF